MGKECGMKKTVIGVTFFIGGMIASLTTVLAAAVNLPHTNGWSTRYPSKLWFLIFAGKSSFNNGLHGLGLGPVFLFGLALLALGIFILLREYFSKD